MEQMRSEFEKFTQMTDAIKEAGVPDEFFMAFKEFAWGVWSEAWQASRQAIEIELPTRKSAYASGYGDGYLVEQQGGEAIGYEETVEVLRAAGLRIKGE